MDPRLVVTVGRQVGTEFEVTVDEDGQAVVLGRDPFCDIRLADPRLSRQHCRIFRRGDHLFLEDMRSRHGTRVNDRRVRSATEVFNGDIVAIGGCRLEVKLGGDRRRESTGIVERMRPKSDAEELAANIESLEGQTFARYRLRKLVHEGEFTVVYAAEHDEDGTPVALRMIARKKGPTIEQINRFVRGARHACETEHPHIVRALKAASYLDTPYVALERLEGDSLRHLVERAGRPMKVSGALRLTRQILSALQFVHEKGLVFRLVRPGEIFVDSEHNARLMGFDLLKELPSERQKEMTRVMDGDLIVDASFAAPEMVAYPVVADQRADVFGAGATLYYMVTARTPFLPVTGESGVGKAFKRVYTDPREINPQVDEALADVIACALKGYVDQRYQTPGAMLDALAGIPAAQ